MYSLQMGKYGSGWTEVDTSNDLLYLIAEGKDSDTYEKFHYRVVDQSGRVLWTKTIPYEGVQVNLIDNNYEWFQSIMSDYGISKELVFEAILHWLKVHVTPNGV